MNAALMFNWGGINDLVVCDLPNFYLNLYIMNLEMWITVIIVIAVFSFIFYHSLKSPFDPEAYEKEQRNLIKDAMRKPKKRKKPKSRAKTTKVKAPHIGKSKRAKK